MTRRINRRTTILHAVGAAAALGAMIGAGCSGLSKPYPAKAFYALRTPDAGAPGAGAPRTGGLRVERVHVNQPFNERTFMLRTGNAEYTPDYYSEFVAEPGSLLTAETVSGLQARRVFDFVLEPIGRASSAYRLEIRVTDLSGDLRPGGKNAAVIEARAMLLHETPGATAVDGDWAFSESEPCSGSSADLAAAWGRAWGRILDDLAGKIRAAR